MHEGRRSEADTDVSLIEAFARRFGRRPEVVVRAPGRVNLLGEHTDYNGLPVLPMAVDRVTRVAAVRRDDDCVRVQNLDSTFSLREYTLADPIPPFSGGDWGNYHKAAALAARAVAGDTTLRGGDFLIASNLPAGAGLSSSSALVVGGAMAFLAINGIDAPPEILAEAAAVAERYVGTRSGGMDQAACLLARAGAALRIDFDPLRTRPVPLPDGVAFVVFDSLVSVRKSGAARRAYNRRVLECRLACRVLEYLLGAELPRPLRHLGDLRLLFPDRRPEEFVRLLADFLPAGKIRPAEIVRLVPAVERELLAGIDAVCEGDELVLPSRVRHVLSEAERLGRAEVLLAAGNTAGFAALMNASHESCRDDYDVSCLELEELVSAARAAGALGARLTGAGFGGCTVNLVASTDVERCRALVEECYYRGRRAAVGREHAFVFAAAAGACVRRL